MPRRVWIAGFPSSYGGADTELDHQIDLLRCNDVEVHLVPMFSPTAEMHEDAARRGCVVHEYRDDIFEDRVVLSWCNGAFLERLPEIMFAGRPRRIVWFNCMTWLFDREREAHDRGWIDLFGFVSDYQRSVLLPQLEGIRPVRSFPYRPYFNTDRAAWRPRQWNDGTYRLGRISRDDGDKFASDTWRIFDRVLVPPGVVKKIYVLGYGPNAEARIGPAPAGLDWRAWGPNEISASAFFATIDTMIHKTGGSRESYCRVLIEAYAHGVVPIVEERYAFPELVIHGETGFMTNESDEMSWYASRLARDPELHRRMAEAGRRHLEEVLVPRDRCWAGWAEVLDDSR